MMNPPDGGIYALFAVGYGHSFRHCYLNPRRGIVGGTEHRPLNGGGVDRGGPYFLRNPGGVSRFHEFVQCGGSL